MLSVGVDGARVEIQLVSGKLACPDCEGRLAPWGHAALRFVRETADLMRLVGACISGLGMAAAIIILHAALAADPAAATPGWIFPVLLLAFLMALAASLWPTRTIYTQPRRDFGVQPTP